MIPGNYIHFILLFFRLPFANKFHRRRLQRILQVIQRLRLAVVLMLFALTVGTTGYVLIEHYTWLEAYYMAVITLASVGFAEVHPLSPAGRIFTTFLILFNVGLFAYAISTITSIFAEGGFTKLFREMRLNRKIEDLNAHTIVCGYGRHAIEVARELASQGMPFVIIENRGEKIELLRLQTDYLYVDGDATEDGVLEEAGLLRARALIITLPDDADNLFITMSARQLNPGLRIISRANNQIDEIKIKRAGANHTVVPEQIGGYYMATLVDQPDLVEFFKLLSSMGPNNVLFEEIPVSVLKPAFQGQPIAQTWIGKSARISVVAIRYANGQYELNPPPDTALQPDWHIVVLGNFDQLREFKKKVLQNLA